jgi:N-acetylglucosaminyldiphosphoundecaprenol N-acetyl-beta-D-mannosaminyltransferase
MGASGRASRRLAGIPIQIATPAEARDRAIALAKGALTTGIGVHLINAYSLSLTDSDASYRSLLEHAGLNFPDGKPLAWVTRLSRAPLQQVRGPGFFNDVLDAGRSAGVRHYLLGGSVELLDKLTAEIEARYPGVTIAGTYSPPFRALTDAEIDSQDAAIRSSAADIVWVGLGTPKQDYEVERIASKLPVVACAVGAAFDFVAGTKREAPRWMTRAGLEWVFRFASEPRRLWRRYLIGNVVFLRAVMRRW